jgi:hypothetical protein
MEVERFMVANGFTQFNPNVNYHDVSPFSSMDGSYLNANDEFSEMETVQLEFSNASGRKRRKGRKGASRGRTRRDERKKRRFERQDARQDRKNRKLAIKEQDSATQKSVADSLGQTSPEEALLMQQLAMGDANQTKTADAGQGMSKGLKIGLIVGGVAVLGLVTFLVIRKMRKK